MANSTRIIDYLGKGTSGDKPASIEIATGALGIYYETDTEILNIWDHGTTAWLPYDLTAIGGTASLGLENLNDVDFTTPPTDGQIMVYDFANLVWIPGDLPTGVESLDDLSDVDLTVPPTAGQILRFNDGTSQWEPDDEQTIPAIPDSFVDLGDTPADYSAASVGDFVVVNAGVDGLEFATPPTIPTNFTDLGDVPSAYTGEGEKLVAVNATEDGLEFIDAPTSLPAGGITGDVLTKQSGTDGDAAWEAPAGGGGSSSFTPVSKGALVRLTSAEAITAATLIPFDAVEYDTNSFWSGANPTRLTVPAGVSKIRLSAGIGTDSTFAADSALILSICKNGDTSAATGRFVSDSVFLDAFSGASGSVVSPILEVSEGDYFEIRINSDDGNYNVRAEPETFFAIEVVEGALLEVVGISSDIVIPTLTGNANKVLQVNAVEDSLEFRPFWPPFQPPAAADFTLVSGDANNLILSDDDDVGLIVDCNVPVAGNIVRFGYASITVPTADWEIVAKLRGVLPNNNFSAWGIGLRDSVSGRFTALCKEGTGNLNIVNSSNLTTYNSSSANPTPRWDNEWFRIVHTGGNYEFYVSADGKAWSLVGTVTDTSYLTNRANQIGMWCFHARTTGLRNIFSCPYYVLTQ